MVAFNVALVRAIRAYFFAQAVFKMISPMLSGGTSSYSGASKVCEYIMLPSESCASVDMTAVCCPLHNCLQWVFTALTPFGCPGVEVR
jgi:hypothetical protein